MTGLQMQGITDAVESVPTGFGSGYTGERQRRATE